MLEDLKLGNLEYKIVKEFLTDLKKELGGGDKKAVEVTELKRLKQEKKTIKEFT